MSVIRKSYTVEFKTKVVREILREEKTLSQIASEYGTHTNVISRWRDQALAALPGAFSDQLANAQAAKEAAWEKEREELYAEIGKLSTQLAWQKKNVVTCLSRDERVALVDRTHGELSLSAQTQLLGLNRTSLYYQPVPPSEEEILLKHWIDTLYTDHPYYGSRRITEQLKREGLEVNRKAVMRHMHEMGLAAVYPGPNLSKRAHTCSPMSRQAILTTFEGWISRISVCGKAGSIWLPSWIGIRVMSSRGNLIKPCR